MMMTGQPLIELQNIYRDYSSGEETVSILKDINLTIHAGEMVAIVGSSGSGKSTLMNILGCLDRPTSGSYRIAGRETLDLPADELARLRREYFGFIFQRYHLLSSLNAVANAEIPAVYAGTPRLERRQRAIELLYRLGLGERLQHHPSQLSGGQQQRISIARALINGGSIILADEPTGALDSFHGKEVMNLLAELNAEGHTVIIVTHDLEVAAFAHRFIAIHDGRIIEDQRTKKLEAVAAEQPTPPVEVAPPQESAAPVAASHWRAQCDQFLEAAKMALLAMKTHRLRTALTMLGIIIGIASVVAVTALGEGSRQRVMRDIAELGTNTIEIYPGQKIGSSALGVTGVLSSDDAEALAKEPYADSVSPTVSNFTQLRYRNMIGKTQIMGVGEQFFRVKGMSFIEGRGFTRDSVKQYAQEAVIDQSTVKKMFGQERSPLGKVVMVGNVPLRIVGVVKDSKGLATGPDNVNVWMPYTSVQARLGSGPSLQAVIVRLRELALPEAAEAEAKSLLQRRHPGFDFSMSNNGMLRKTAESTNNTLHLLITSIAAISLLVGGIGVMNIMLVSVSERTKEIGVRMAVGARQRNIMQQFLIEAVLVCLIGGLLGILLAFGIGVFFNRTNTEFSMIFSANAIVAAFATCTLIGMMFGFVPARNAARLNPVEALVRES